MPPPQAVREHKGIALILLDIDYFKQFNDEYGERGVTMADEALYEAKQAGRNCSVVHQTEASLAHSQNLRKSVWPQPATA